MTMTACSTAGPDIKFAEEMVQQEQWDAAVGAYREALKKDPFNQEIEKALSQAKIQAAQIHYQKGRKLLNQHKLPAAMQEFEIALGLDPSRPEHHAALEDIVRLKDARERMEDGKKLQNLGRYDDAMNAYEQAIELDPNLTEALNGITAIAEQQKVYKSLGGTTEAVTLRFQNTRLKQVFEILARTANINILFEKDVRDDLVTIFTKDTPFDEALNLILSTNQLFSRRIGPDTLLIIPDTKQKRQQYEDLQIRTFYLSTAKAKDMANLLRTILETKRVYVNEPLNTVVIRDEPEKLQLAEQVILANDRRDSEVELTLEVLEVSRNQREKIGLSFAKQVGAGVFPGSAAAASFGETASTQTFKFEQLTGLGPDSYLFKFPSNILLDFFKTESNAKTLASPKIRVLNNQKASINVGDKEPILLSTTSTNPNLGGSVATQSTVTSIEFKDTGVKLDVEPTIHLTGEITIKLKVEVTRIGEQVTLQDNPLINQFRFGTRTAETTLNLRDGETVVLAGLIQEEDRKTRDSIPGLDDVPIIEDLFGREDRKVDTEVILVLTSRIIRSVMPPNIVKHTLWSGTADQYSTKPLFSPREQAPILDVVANNETAQLPESKQPTSDSTTPVKSSEKGTPSSPISPKPQPTVPPKSLASKIVLTPSEITTGPGQTIEMILTGESIPETQLAQITISYNPELLEFTEALPGQFFRISPKESSMTVSAAPQSGTVVLQFGRTGHSASGSGQLATVVFKTKAKGDSPLVIKQPKLTGPSGQSVPITVQHSLIRIL
ncbi:secretin N-terminal domain-containing protein [Candidatus Nitronereus thalassa]|uniref:Tetratricopeptide repeat protein n=1 Tax=Candidatus Nitronereus thalassa TaxID=3020898 RepID=A0ABU3K3W8_9BACT|nr:secretin N-terminal domain-containing protein [Candidatus Nitronereus thalassa]MDT7041077.1 tetratricopeptide repeat protein [Candidatus Nitronereus thalassa]